MSPLPSTSASVSASVSTPVLPPCPPDGDGVVIDGGTFAWAREGPPCLRRINMRVKRGSLVAVVGHVGSGKSSLLSAMLGEMEKRSGSVCVKVRDA